MGVLSQAFALVFDWYVLWVILASAVFGLFVGAVPGLTATMATALLVPVTFFMPPVPAVAAIVTATAMAIFAGDIPSCLLRMPGTPASAAYTDEAYAMTKKGYGEIALGASLVFSVVGGRFGTAARLQAGCDEDRAADEHRRPQRAGEQARADVLPRDARKALHVPEDRRAEESEQRPPDGIVELHDGEPSLRSGRVRGAPRGHLTMPTAFIVAPRSVSDFAMKRPNSSGGR